MADTMDGFEAFHGQDFALHLHEVRPESAVVPNQSTSGFGGKCVDAGDGVKLAVDSVDAFVDLFEALLSKTISSRPGAHVRHTLTGF